MLTKPRKAIRVMSKKYRYIRLDDLPNYDGWDLVHIIPRLDMSHYQMGVVCLDDSTQKDVESYINTIKTQKLEIDMLIRKKGYLQDEICELKQEVERLKEFKNAYNSLFK